MTREEHLKWCKKRALAHLPQDPREAVNSMISDIRKHPDTSDNVLMALGLFALRQGNVKSARDYIVGFN